MKKKTAVKEKQPESHNSCKTASAERQWEHRREIAMRKLEERINKRFRNELIQYMEHNDMVQKDISVKLNEDQSTISKFISGTKWGIPKLAVKARIMEFDFEAEYEECAEIHNTTFAQHMEQKKKDKQTRGRRK